MSIGFTAAEPVAEPSDEVMATMALDTGAVNLDRVLAFYAAKHLMAGMSPSPEDLAAFANWLTQGMDTDPDADPDEDEDDEDEDEPEPDDNSARCHMLMCDWWPPVVASTFTLVAFILIVYLS